MANSFVKWCRAKFFNGYKHINVLAQEEGCGRSDTETLVRAGEDELFISTPTPTPAPTHPPTSHGRPASHHPHHPLAAGTYVEEVSCDVSVAAGDLERQEFSFTLYDFDGHGKVTKDDIAGLVRTIYEAVGSSLSLPPSGSRTIKVKLTVAPDSNRSRTQPQEDKEAEQEDKEGDDEDYEDDDGCGGVGGNGGGGRGGQRGRRRGGRRRSTSLQRHELLQIIQANMEKNNLFYTPLHRPHHPHYPHHHSHPHHHHHHHPRRRRPRPSCPCSPPDPAQVKARLLDADCPCRQTHYHSHTHGPPTGSRMSGCRRHHRSHSHDLTRDSPPHVFRAHLLEKAFHPLPPSNTPDQPPSPPTLPHHHHHHHHQQPRHHHHHHHHHRSRSYDGGDTQRSSPRGRVGRGSRCTQQDSPHSQKSPTEQQLTTSPSKETPRGVGVTGGVSGGVDGSPNPSKHRQRAAEHDRAMAQVVAWLERGTLLDTPTPCSPTTNTTPTSPNTTPNTPNATEQTHHVHQHIHHHYHHYGNQHLPPLVL